MNKVKSMVKKELLDILRDKKTLIIMLVMPVVIYPALLIAMVMGVNYFMQREEEKLQIVGYDSAYENVITDIKNIYEENKEDLDSELEFKATSADDEEIVLWLDLSKEDDIIHAKVEYESTDSSQRIVQSTLKDVFDIYRESIVTQRLEANGLSEDFIYPVTYEKEDTISVSKSLGIGMGGSFGMMLVLMIFMGAFYPAIDVTTGERERGTLETLLTLPVSNFQMIMSKYIAVSIVASVTAILSLLAFAGSFIIIMLSSLAEETIDVGTIEPLTLVLDIIVLLFVVITVALLMTAISMCFSIFAKTNKEANNYITPVMLVVMLASMVGVIPSVVIDQVTSLIPIVNVSLLIKSVVAQEMSIAYAFNVIIVNAVFSVLVIWVLSRLYDSETVLFSDGFKNIRIFQSRSEIKKGTVPGVGDVLLSIVVMLMLNIYIGTLIVTTTKNTLFGTAVNQLFIVGVPLFVVWYLKTDAKKLFSINKLEAKSSIIGSVVLYIGTFAFMIGIMPLLTRLFEESTENVNVLFEDLFDNPFPIVAFVVACMPAICEEIFFRGFVLGSFKNKLSPKWAIILTSLIFGAYHMSVVKMFTTTLLGLCFAIIVDATGCIFITMVLHCINNLLSVLGSFYPEQMQKLLPILFKEQLSSSEIAIMIGLGIVLIALGLFLIKKACKGKN